MSEVHDEFYGASIHDTPWRRRKREKHVAKVVDIVDESGLPYVITPMGTIIESKTWDEVMSVLKQGFEKMQEECSRISITIKIDYREGKAGRIKAKIESLERKLGKELHKID